MICILTCGRRGQCYSAFIHDVQIGGQSVWAIRWQFRLICEHSRPVVVLTDTDAPVVYLHGRPVASSSQTPRWQNIYQPALCPRSWQAEYVRSYNYILWTKSNYEIYLCAIEGSWCHCHSLSLASVKSRLVLPFWYRLTWVVLEKGR